MRACVMGMVFVLIGKDTSSHDEGGADDSDEVNAHMFLTRRRRWLVSMR